LRYPLQGIKAVLIRKNNYCRESVTYHYKGITREPVTSVTKALL
jgi:hypothetical protein